MGKVQITTREQKIILDELRQSDYFRSRFYFTGGTALSLFYLQHRYSDDLDLFSSEKYNNQVIFTLMKEWGRKHKFTFQSRFAEVVYIFNLVFPNRKTLKVDFGYYPYKQMDKRKEVERFQIDSLLDIATNKLLSVNQRDDVKDFVDLYFLKDKFTFWDLMPRVKMKFNMEVDPLLLAADLLKVEDFDYLPKMIKPLKLIDLKQFFRQRAKEIGGRVTV